MNFYQIMDYLLEEQLSLGQTSSSKKDKKGAEESSLNPFKKEMFEILRDELLEMKLKSGEQTAAHLTRESRIAEITENSIRQKNLKRMKSHYKAVERKVEATKEVMKEEARKADE